MKDNNKWRVTDPDAGNEGAQDFLPNPIIYFSIDDLKDADSAKAIIDIWGGHPGTIGKQFRLNDSAWIDIPVYPTHLDNPQCYMNQYNTEIDIPLEYLVEGENKLEGTSGGQSCYNFNWGQWGWYLFNLRVFYSPKKAHPIGGITKPKTGDTISEFPKIICNASSDTLIEKIEILANYNGYDVDGDNVFFEWHRYYHDRNIAENVATMYNEPYTAVWNTQMVPDQDSYISIVARIKDSRGYWYVTEIIDSLILKRNENVSVKIYNSNDIPEKFWVRAGQNKHSYISIPDTSNAIQAWVHHRTWNGKDDWNRTSESGFGSGSVNYPLRVNDWM
ncbi:MAG: hypothetical protein KAR20_26800, partial [Candidatus Heimdallarchaeota archaeon]|nr:hypothetical protein [Candidatus Heimdallarchaeota archaeon]